METLSGRGSGLAGVLGAASLVLFQLEGGEIELVGLLEGELEDLGHVADADELELVLDLLRDLFEIRDVALGEEDPLDARAVRGQDLLLDATDRLADR